MLAQTDDIVEKKRALRAAALSKRDALAPDFRASAARTVSERGLPFNIYKNTVFSAYEPMRSEFDPRPLLEKIAAAGGRIVLPAIVEGRIVFRLHEPGTKLIAGAFGTSEPPADARELKPDILLVPLLAFDAKGNRLGYGKGYYDAAIRGMRAERRVGAVGLAFEGQHVDEVPVTERDQRLDLILTEQREYWAPREKGR
ncbi:MAG TPA: 5-formyltetrahydrofolate cyclo-ligase [Xanthobacteraceae bacterium]|jgi:5-formyltetrahydrofolate cyclo-ligase